MILPAVNVNGIHLSSQQHEALVSIWRTGRMPEPHAGQKPWLWIQALRRRGLVSDNALRLTDKGRHIVQLLQDRKAVPYRQSTLRSLLERLLQQPVNLPISARFGNHLQKEL